MNDDAIVAFGPLPQLDEVNFHRTPIGDRGLAHVLSSGKVNSLIIGEGALTDASLAVVAQYPAPRWLVLSQMRLTDRGLQSLAGKQFGTLILSNASITDEGFRALAEIHGLEYVCLRANPITGIGVRHLKADQPLSHLDLSGAPLTPEGIAALANLQCSELVLARTPLDDEGLMLLVENDFLTRLDVTETQITLEGAKAFYEARKNRRHQDAEETLWLICDYPEVLEAITGAEAIGGPYGYGSLGQSPY